MSLQKLRQIALREVVGTHVKQAGSLVEPDRLRFDFSWDGPVGFDELQEVERLVTVGDLISIRREVSELKNRRLAGKAMDNRACVTSLTLALEQLSGMQHTWDVFAVATVQEEIGVKGAVTATYGIAPDVGIALDVTLGSQPEVPEVEAIPLDKGPVITIGPTRGAALSASRVWALRATKSAWPVLVTWRPKVTSRSAAPKPSAWR